MKYISNRSTDPYFNLAMEEINLIYVRDNNIHA